MKDDMHRTRTENSRLLRWLAAVAILAVVTHLAIFAALHLLEPGLDPASSIISDYLSSSSGKLAATAFGAFAVVWAALAGLLGLAGRRRPLLVSAALLFGMASIGIMLGAAFPEAADPRQQSSLALLQSFIGRLARPGLFLGILLASIDLRRSRVLPVRAGVLMALALAILALFGTTVGVLLGAGFGGVGQRVLFGLIYAWVLLVAMPSLSLPLEVDPDRSSTS